MDDHGPNYELVSFACQLMLSALPSRGQGRGHGCHSEPRKHVESGQGRWLQLSHRNGEFFQSSKSSCLTSFQSDDQITDLDGPDTGGIVLGAKVETENERSPESEYHLSTNGSRLAEGDNEAAGVVSYLNNTPTVDEGDTCSVHSEPVSLPAAHLPHLTFS